MADESIRRSGRATKGQHTKTSSSPAPNAKGGKAAKGAASKKKGAATASQATSEAGDDDDETIRCICGNDNPKDKRAFIGCDACSVWQHNVCMGMPDDDDEVGEHYFCEQCRPEEHEETLQALEKGEKIWDTRNKIWQAEKKMSKNRKARSGGKGGWLKKDVVKAEEPEVKPQEEPPVEVSQEMEAAPKASEPVEAASKDTGNKRKRESEVPAADSVVQEEAAVEPPKEQKKRRKSSSAPKKATEDPETALVPIDQLPTDRKKIAQALSKTTADGVKERVASNGFRIPDGQTPKSLGDYHASRIEYALAMNYEGTQNADYAKQFRMIVANLKQNKTLLQELLAGSLTADELVLMESSEMASDELQKQRADMKAEADRQATIDQKETTVRYRRTHKGDELVEDENATTSSAPASRPVRHSISEAEMADSGAQAPGSPGAAGRQPSQTPLGVDTSRPAQAEPDRRSSSQQNFNVDKIWAHTAQSPTQANVPRLARKPSTIQPQPGGAKVDADVDRMLADGDDESYSPADAAGLGNAVWRGKIAQASGESSPTVNARYVAGRDVSSTIPWKDLLPPTLNIDGRLMIAKAEEYLCGLQWSVTSDVSVLALTPHDDIAAFNTVFEYFTTRGRYAVVNKDRPALVKDLYLIPLEVGSKLPDHVEMLDYSELKAPIEERVIIATFVLARHTPEGSPTPSKPAAVHPTPDHTNGNDNGQPPIQHLPEHLRQGPQGSPLQQSGPHFSPSQQNFGPGSPMPPNPYTAPPPPQHGTPPAYQNPAYTQAPPAAPAPPFNRLAAEVLGEFYNAPTASMVLLADPGIDRDRLENLRKIFQDDEKCRTDMMALQGKLGL